MFHAQNDVVASFLAPQSFGTSATVSATVSVVGYRYAKVELQLATASSTDTTVQLQEGDTTSVFATATDLAMATAASSTSVMCVYGWLLDLRKRKKFLKIVYQPSGAARIGACLITLSKAEQPPTTAAGRGYTLQVLA